MGKCGNSDSKKRGKVLSRLSLDNITAVKKYSVLVNLLYVLINLRNSLL
jgi:hypothetical protein